MVVLSHADKGWIQEVVGDYTRGRGVGKRWKVEADRQVEKKSEAKLSIPSPVLFDCNLV